MELPLVWNFIFNKTTTDVLPLPPSARDAIKWEARFFWPDYTPIYLQAIDPGLLDLSAYKYKQREDVYYLLPESSYNLKYRRKTLLYKPCIQQAAIARGFGPKINLDVISNHTTSELFTLRQQALEQGHSIPVNKEAYIYKFNAEPRIKLELARLVVKNRVYFSLCVEGRACDAVETVYQRLLGSKVSCDYVSFLQGLESA